MSKNSDQIRKAFKKADDVRDRGLTVPEDVERFTDLLYGTDPKWQVLDIYRPKLHGDGEGMIRTAEETDESGDPKKEERPEKLHNLEKAQRTEEQLKCRRPEKLPVIISVHGGAWVYGDKERYQYYAMSLAGRGFAVINYTYRLAPEFKFPTALEDLNLVVEFALSHAEEYGLDMDHVFAVGDSAGGNYLGLYASMTCNKDYAGKFHFHVPDGFFFRAAAFNCASFHPDGGKMNRRIWEDLFEHGGTEEERSMLYVDEYMTAAFPPSFVMTATGDFLKMQPAVIEPVLLANNIPHEIRFYSARNAGGADLGHVFHLNMRLPEAARCNDEECAFFRSFLGE